MRKCDDRDMDPALGLVANILEIEASVRRMEADLRRHQETTWIAREELSTLQQRLSDTLDGLTFSQAADEVSSAVTDSMAQKVSESTSRLDGELLAREQATAAHVVEFRRGHLRAIENFLLHHDLPETSHQVDLSLRRREYHATLSGSTPSLIHFSLALEPCGLFARPVRVRRFVRGLRIHLPEQAGWLRKRTKLQPHKLGKLWITQVRRTRGQMLVRLRLDPEAPATGFDLVISSAEPFVQVVRIEPTQTATVYTLRQQNIAAVMAFARALTRSIQEVATQPRVLTQLTLDGQLFAAERHALLFVQRVVDSIAPAVGELEDESLIARFRELPAEFAQLLAPLGLAPPAGRPLSGDTLVSIESAQRRRHQTVERRRPIRHRSSA